MEEVAKLAELHTSTVSMCNAFFVAAGLLTRDGKGFIPSRAVIDYTLAQNEWQDPNAGLKLAADLEKTWFSDKLRIALQAKGKLSLPDALQLLGEGAGVSKEYEPQLRTLIEYAKIAGLVQEDGDGLRLRGKSGASSGAGAAPAVAQRNRSVSGSSDGGGGATGGGSGGINVNLNLSVTMADMAGWDVEKVKEFMFALMTLQRLAAVTKEDPDG